MRLQRVMPVGAGLPNVQQEPAALLRRRRADLLFSQRPCSRDMPSGPKCGCETTHGWK